MPCFHPIDAWQPTSKEGVSQQLVFHAPVNTGMTALKISCGQCVGCRLERSRQWAMRCMHEAQTHKENCFITLTFSPEALASRKNPKSLEIRDFQLFMKRLRKKYGSGIRFYHCGEYGEKNGRPHYHACLFGHDFKDKIFYKQTHSGFPLFRSPELEELWPYGFSTVGSMTFESAAYCARYIMKKQTGKNADEYYCKVDPSTGEILSDLKPEYNTMSRRPGIGKKWFDQYHGDVYPHDYVVINGKRSKPPRYYDNILKTNRPYEFDEIQHERLEQASKSNKKHYSIHGEYNNSPERLLVREKCLINNVLSQLPRNRA